MPFNTHLFPSVYKNYEGKGWGRPTKYPFLKRHLHCKLRSSSSSQLLKIHFLQWRNEYQVALKKFICVHSSDPCSYCIIQRYYTHINRMSCSHRGSRALNNEKVKNAKSLSRLNLKVVEGPTKVDLRMRTP